MRFYKYQATGNDFIIIDSPPNKLTPERVKKACDRHYGIGSDGLIVNAASAVADTRMDFYNPDGSQAEMCGNGIRCLARFLVDYKNLNKSTILIESKAGLKELTIDERLQITVDMGEPQELGEHELNIGGQSYKINTVSIGNPHAVIFVDSLKEVELIKVGPVIEDAKLFKSRTNVEFVQVENSAKLKVLVWERGAGATLSCGTGACASLVQAAYHGLSERKAVVSLPGGELQINWANDNKVYLSGPAEKVFEGTVEW